MRGRTYKRCLTAVCIPALVMLSACGGSGGDSTAGLPRPNSAGAKAVASAGCLGCHRIGDAGSGGPGPELTHIGASLSRAQVERVLESPPGGMPSFADNPNRSQIAAYMASMR
jgi:mono/diheme cytochrome c family protein